MFLSDNVTDDNYDKIFSDVWSAECHIRIMTKAALIKLQPSENTESCLW